MITTIIASNSKLMQLKNIHPCTICDLLTVEPKVKVMSIFGFCRLLIGFFNTKFDMKNGYKDFTFNSSATQHEWISFEVEDLSL